jgi:hypothetical protein
MRTSIKSVLAAASIMLLVSCGESGTEKAELPTGVTTVLSSETTVLAGETTTTTEAGDSFVEPEGRFSVADETAEEVLERLRQGGEVIERDLRFLLINGEIYDTLLKKHIGEGVMLREGPGGLALDRDALSWVRVWGSSDEKWEIRQSIVLFSTESKSLKYVKDIIKEARTSKVPELSVSGFKYDLLIEYSEPSATLGCITHAVTHSGQAVVSTSVARASCEDRVDVWPVSLATDVLKRAAAVKP